MKHTKHKMILKDKAGILTETTFGLRKVVTYECKCGEKLDLLSNPGDNEFLFRTISPDRPDNSR